MQGSLSSLELRVQFCLLVCCTYPSSLTVNKEKNLIDQRASDTRETQHCVFRLRSTTVLLVFDITDTLCKYANSLPPSLSTTTSCTPTSIDQSNCIQQHPPHLPWLLPLVPLTPWIRTTDVLQYTRNTCVVRRALCCIPTSQDNKRRRMACPHPPWWSYSLWLHVRPCSHQTPIKSEKCTGCCCFTLATKTMIRQWYSRHHHLHNSHRGCAVRLKVWPSVRIYHKTILIRWL